jgi:prepilin-type N-terminal cleavage/methylation domain-containing protein
VTPYRRPGGFTLIELAVTLLVLAIAIGIALPTIGRSVDDLRARAEVSGFAAFLRAAREQAVVRGEPHAVRLVPETRSLVITGGDVEAVRSMRTFNHLVRIEPDPPEQVVVRFEPQGLSTGGSFRLVGKGRRAYVVTVDALTGRVSSRPAES